MTLGLHQVTATTEAGDHDSASNGQGWINLRTTSTSTSVSKKNGGVTFTSLYIRITKF